MNLIKHVLAFSLLTHSSMVFSNTTEDILVQINGKYLPIPEAVATRRNLRLEIKDNKLQFKVENNYYPINSKNILILLGREQLTLDLENTFPNAKIYLDNYFTGVTDDKGFAHFSQIYPESGPHTLKITKNKISIPPFKFDLEKASTISCSGKNNFSCHLA